MSPDNTGAHGVTNHIGEIFTGDLSETHSGLIVMDGALIPNAIGVNPFATIAALAERNITHYARRNHLVISEEKNGILDLYGEPAHVPRSHEDDQRLETVTNLMREAQILKFERLDFVELLSGFIHEESSSQNNRYDQKSAYERAYNVGKGRGQSARLFVNVAVTDPEMLLNDGGSSGILTGTFVCPTIRGSPFMVLQGDFGLFKPDEATAGTSRLTYDFGMVGVDGRRLKFHAYKLVDPSVTLDPRQLWHSTTTLYVSITERLSGTVLATGILSLGFGDLFSEFLSLTSTGNHLMDKAFKVANFVSFFALKSASFFLAPMAPLQYPVQTYQSYMNYTPPTRTFLVVSEDGIRTELHMWEPSPNAVATGADGRPVEVQDLFMIPGASVDHQIYSLPTIPFNAVNYFTRAGYRVFVTVHRIGMLRWTRGQRWTTYDARLDIKACLERIRSVQAEPKKIYTIAHCMGSVAFSCGLLDGTIPASWILGITCSQVFMNPIWAPLNMAKATSPLALDKMYNSLLGDWLECTTSKSDTLSQQALNQMLRFYPEERSEMCANAACHRTTLLFGRCWSHHNLNEATHRNIDRFFGGSSMVCIDLLKRMGSNGHVSTNAPAYRTLTTDDNVARLRGIPFLFFSGGESAVLSPAATEKTFERLRDTFGVSAGLPSGGVQYRRRVVPGYGHLDCWMGKDAWRDVYPFVREEVDRVVRGEAYRFCPPQDRFARIIDAGTI
ncbi:Cholesterol oxidase [Escovopsis weberi]|uniref:Cholesterol oxidase n=1 Tax=Escovopsis weberi TaxID=150374 RepID=A0A0M8N4C1_ESCWE|nr:Cholesterol oxidase [Escovopsis weberi]